MLARNPKHASGIPATSQRVNCCAGGLLFLAVLASAHADTLKPKAQSHYQGIVGDDSEEESARWNHLFKQKRFVFGTEPSTFLKESLSLLPKGKALDLAMGEGRNAVFLAAHGWQVAGVDFSEAAIKKAKLLARQRRVQIEAINADLRTYTIASNAYDLIVSIEYFERSLLPKIRDGLKPGGVAIFELPERELQTPDELASAFSGYERLLSRSVSGKIQWIVRKKGEAP